MGRPVILASDLDRQVTFERRTRPLGLGKAGQETWEPVATVWAQVQDVLPSRSEKLADGLSIASRPARIRVRYRTDISADMRVIYSSRVMQIIAGPAEIGRREGLELMAAEYSTAGSGA